MELTSEASDPGGAQMRELGQILQALGSGDRGRLAAVDGRYPG